MFPPAFKKSTNVNVVWLQFLHWDTDKNIISVIRVKIKSFKLDANNLEIYVFDRSAKRTRKPEKIGFGSFRHPFEARNNLFLGTFRIRRCFYHAWSVLHNVYLFESFSKWANERQSDTRSYRYVHFTEDTRFAKKNND